jgi:hypothetical protein
MNASAMPVKNLTRTAAAEAQVQLKAASSSQHFEGLRRSLASRKSWLSVKNKTHTAQKTV